MALLESMNKVVRVLLLVLIITNPTWAQYSKSERKIGATVYQTIEQTQGFYEDEELLALVKEIGQSLEKQLDKPYNFKYFLVDNTEPNAFATAGGYVFVTRGLLAIINTKDELAGVLGHEFTHVTERHTTKQIRASILPSLLELPANIIGLLTVKEVADIINLPISAITGLATNAYSRSQEKVADQKGIELARKAGYDPYALPEVLLRMNSYLTLATGQPPKKSLFSDHPMTEDRVVYLREQLNNEQVENSATSGGTPLRELDQLIFGQNPANGVVNSNVFVHQGIDLYCEFPTGWEVQNLPQAVTAVNQATDATIVMSIEASDEALEQVARKSLESLDKKTIVRDQERTNINGLVVYRATLEYTKKKHAGQVSEIMWMKLPTGVLLKVIGIASNESQVGSITDSFETFRLLVKDDLAHTPKVYVSLKSLNSGSSVGNFLNTNQQLAPQTKLLMILNGTRLSDTIPKDRYFKVLEASSLLE
jgi:predicted Zn-dependent protease